MSTSSTPFRSVSRLYRTGDHRLALDRVLLGYRFDLVLFGFGFGLLPEEHKSADHCNGQQHPKEDLEILFHLGSYLVCFSLFELC